MEGTSGWRCHFAQALHVPVKTGCRFSAKAVRPSKRSCVGITCTSSPLMPPNQPKIELPITTPQTDVGGTDRIRCVTHRQRDHDIFSSHLWRHKSREYLSIVRLLQSISSLQVHVHAAVYGSLCHAQRNWASLTDRRNVPLSAGLMRRKEPFSCSNEFLFSAEGW